MTEQDFQHFNFPLDPFQKRAIVALDQGHNVLICAKTGSGKTVPAEYLIRKALGNQRKIIYTSPIKSLSNQKFHEFTEKFPGEKIGIVTGDIKFNPDANCLIMTTEILRNLLYHKTIILDRQTGLSLTVNMSEVESVIFDEVHYINDRERGKVWEECLILLPSEITLLLLSATIGRAEQFAAWLQSIKNKPMDLIENENRVVPLKYYLYWTLKSTKTLKELSADEQHRLYKKSDILNEFFNTDSSDFKDSEYQELFSLQKKYSDTMEHLQILNQITDYLHKHDMLPVLFFTLSRHKCEQYARLINRSLNSSEDGQKVERIIMREIHKLDNPEYYLNLGEFQNLKSLLIKGIAYHHSGLIPVFKEIIEILFSQRLVSVLFATETFSVGVNMPTRTVVFTGLSKVDGSAKGDFRWLETHEFGQMCGRAGRRNWDKVGHVILLPNLYQVPPLHIMKMMIQGDPMSIRSQFTLNYGLILRTLINSGNFVSQNPQNLQNSGIFVSQNPQNLQNSGSSIGTKLRGIIEGSLWNRELSTDLTFLREQQKHLQSQLDKMDLSEIGLFQEYQQMINNVENIGGLVLKLSNKELKKRQKHARSMETPEFLKKFNNYSCHIKPLLDKLTHNQLRLDDGNSVINDKLNRVFLFLTNFEYISGVPENFGKSISQSESFASQNPQNLQNSDFSLGKPILLSKGVLAAHVGQCQEMLIVEMLYRGVFDDLEPVEIAATLAVFSTDIRLDTPVNRLTTDTPLSVRLAAERAKSISEDLQREEEYRGLTDLRSNWDVSLDLVQAAFLWASGKSWTEILKCAPTYSGNLVKEFLKISNVSVELAGLAQIIEKQDLLTRVEQIPNLMLRELVTVESLYLKK